jgi:hypothetical protein
VPESSEIVFAFKKNLKLGNESKASVNIRNFHMDATAVSPGMWLVKGE